MTVSDLSNIFLRLQMAGKEVDSEIVFDSGEEGAAPFCITGVHLDPEGDVCLECDERVGVPMSLEQVALAVSAYESQKTSTSCIQI